MARLGPYDITEPLGSGATGQVFGGVHRETGTRVAAKLARGDISPKSSALASILHELELVTRLDHPGIVVVLDGGYLPDSLTVGSESYPAGTAYMVVERADGTLRDHRPESWEEARQLLVTLLDALAYAHARKLLHRDIKPDNVLRVGGSWKLGDFGLGSVYTARQASPNAGSPQFMAPEQFRGADRDLLPATDLYGVGGLAYWLVCGRPPFEAQNYLDFAQAHLEDPIPDLAPQFEVPDGLQRWIGCMLAKQQNNRFFRAADARHALDHLHDPTCWRPVGPGSLLTTSVPTPPTWRRDIVQRADELVAASLSLFGMRDPPLIGRDPERDRLWGVLSDVHRTQHAHVVIVEGDVGSGKSRLAQWLCERAEEVGAATYMTGFGDPARGDDAVLMDMVARYLRSTDLGPGEARARARQLFDLYGVPPDWRLDALERLLAEASRDEAEQELTSGERHALIWQLVQTVSAGRPVIVHLDDAHHGVAGLEMIQALFEDGAPRARVLFLLTCERGAEIDPRAAQLLEQLCTASAVSRIRLGELSTSEVRTLLRELLRLEGRLANKLAERVGGNPLFAVQLVTDWVARGALSFQDGQLHLDPAAWPELPDSIWHVWRERLSGALGTSSGDGHRALELAAILGREVLYDDWMAVCAAADVTPPPHLLERMFASGLGRGEDDAWKFAHAMLREALLKSCRDAGRWRDFNRIVGDYMLSKSTQHSTYERVGRAARHFVEAGDNRASSLLVEAMTAAQQSDDHYFTLELHDELQDLVDPLHDRIDRCRGDLLAAESLIRLGDSARALELVDGSLETCRRLALTDVEAEAHRIEGVIHRTVGRVLDAVASTKSAVELYGRANDADGLARSTLQLAEAYAYTARHAEACELYREVRHRFATLGQKRLLAHAEYGLGYSLQQRGELDACETYFGHALQLFTELGALTDAHDVLISLGDLARERGELDLAEERYRSCSEFFELTHDMGGMVVYLNLAIIELERGDIEAMRGWTEYSRQAAEAYGLEVMLAAIDALSLACDAAEGDWPAWDRDFEALPRRIAKTGVLERDDLMVVERAAELTAKAGEHSRAARAFELLAQLSERAGDVDRQQLARRRVAELRS